MAATCSVLYVALERIFWEMTSRVISAFSAYLLDSGYMYGVSFWVFHVFSTWRCSRVVLSPFIPAFAEEEAAVLVVVNGDMAVFAGYVAPRVVLWHVQGGFLISRCVLFAWRQAQAFRHRGGYGPEGQFLRSHTCGVHRCSSWTLFSCPFLREDSGWWSSLEG